jgi:hypothetical protein
MDADLKQVLEAMRQENAAAHAETRRHSVVVAEGLRREIQLVAEGVLLNGEKLDRVDTRLDQLTDNFEERVTQLEAVASQHKR